MDIQTTLIWRSSCLLGLSHLRGADLLASAAAAACRILLPFSSLPLPIRRAPQTTLQHLQLGPG